MLRTIHLLRPRLLEGLSDQEGHLGWDREGKRHRELRGQLVRLEPTERTRRGLFRYRRPAPE